MPYSSGTFAFTPNSFAPTPTSGATIASAAATSTWSDIATALSSCVLKDGSQTITANLPLGGFKLTGLGAGTASGNSLRYEQVNGVATTAGDLLYATAAGTLARLGIGTAGQVLRTNSGATAPEWVSVPTGAQTFLGGDVALNNTANFFDIVNTGSIGASGQKWLIIVVANVTDTGAAAQCTARIWDGTTVFAAVNYTVTAANVETFVTLAAIVSPSAATTYYLSCKDTTNATGVVQTTAVSGTANKATSITAVRLV